MSFPLYFFFQQFKNNFYQFKNTKKYKINLTPIFTIKPTSYLYLSLNSSPSSSKNKKNKKKHHLPQNKFLMFLLLMTSPLNLNCLKFNNQSSLFLSLFLTYHLLISAIMPASYLYLSLNSSSSFSQKKKKKKNTSSSHQTNC